MKDTIVGYGGTAFGTVMTVIQTNEILQIIQGILTLIALLVTIAYTIWKWWKNASKDGKITPQEIDDLMDEVKDITDDVNKK